MGDDCSHWAMIGQTMSCLPRRIAAGMAGSVVILRRDLGRKDIGLPTMAPPGTPVVHLRNVPL